MKMIVTNLGCPVAGATLIRKRDGSTRVATPYEEMKRSWGGKQPSYLEVSPLCLSLKCSMRMCL